MSYTEDTSSGFLKSLLTFDQTRKHRNPEGSNIQHAIIFAADPNP
jgi:hypothetical protein